VFNELHKAQLERGISDAALVMRPSQIEQLMAFLQLMVKWNRVYNLSAIKEPEEMVSLHLLDSLSVLPFLHGKRCIDVGTGAGLPGLPLAIAKPEVEFVLLDSNSKKTRFIQQVCIELGLKNVEPLHERVENYNPEQKFDTVIARALSALPNLLTKTRHLLLDGGKLLAMKSKETDELVRDDFQFDEVKALNIAGLDATRNLVIYTAK
jgi:16S rRNA (guanine527-N7)-methyltransferase